jgi:hypothetical protein
MVPEVTKSTKQVKPIAPVVENEEKKPDVMHKIFDGLSMITSGSYDSVIKERGLNKEKLIKELANSKTFAEVANVLKKIC